MILFPGCSRLARVQHVSAMLQMTLPSMVSLFNSAVGVSMKAGQVQGVNLPCAGTACLPSSGMSPASTDQMGLTSIQVVSHRLGFLQFKVRSTEARPSLPTLLANSM